MIWILIFLILILSVAIVAFPLFFSKIQVYKLPENSDNDFNQADSWLSALGDLEVDFSLGRISKREYQQQKIFLQRSYLNVEETSGES